MVPPRASAQIRHRPLELGAAQLVGEHVVEGAPGAILEQHPHLLDRVGVALHGLECAVDPLLVGADPLGRCNQLLHRWRRGAHVDHVLVLELDVVLGVGLHLDLTAVVAVADPRRLAVAGEDRVADVALRPRVGVERMVVAVLVTQPAGTGRVSHDRFHLDLLVDQSRAHPRAALAKRLYSITPAPRTGRESRRRAAPSPTAHAPSRRRARARPTRSAGPRRAPPRRRRAPPARRAARAGSPTPRAPPRGSSAPNAGMKHRRAGSARPPRRPSAHASPADTSATPTASAARPSTAPRRTARRCPPPASAAAPPPAPPARGSSCRRARSPARAGTCGTRPA